MGGSRYDLSPEERQRYKFHIKQLLTYYNTDLGKFRRNIIIVLEILYNVVEKVIINNNLPQSSQEKYLGFLKKIRENSNSDFFHVDSLELGHSFKYSFQGYNLCSLQCVILLTLLDIESKKIEEDKLMKSYPSGFKILDVFRGLTLINWLDIKELKQKCLEDIYLKKIIYNYK